MEFLSWLGANWWWLIMAVVGVGSVIAIIIYAIKG